MLFFVFKLEVGTDPSSVYTVPPSSGSTALLISVHPDTFSEFSFSFELEGVTDDSTVAAVPPSSVLLLFSEFEFEGGTGPSIVYLVPPSYGSTALLVSVHPYTSSKFSFFLNWKEALMLLLLLESLPPLYFCYCLHSN